MSPPRTLAPLLMALCSAAAAAEPSARVPAGEFVPADGVCPWHDRSGAWVMVDVPTALSTGEAVPLQSCTTRTVEVPVEGLEAVLVGVFEDDIAQLAALLPGRTVDSGLRFGVQSPRGGEKLAYRALVVSRPPRRIELSGAKAGLILLSLVAPRTAAALPREPFASPLPERFEVEAQEWPCQPGPRRVAVLLAAPPGGITASTGLMLCLHNWGGRHDAPEYVAWCRSFSERYNVIAMSVNYLQSGGGEPTVPGQKPYDHGYLQAGDCLRALHSVRQSLGRAGIPFNPRRTYAMGGSGGGNVSLMVSKLAPRSFACVVDICGMPGLTDGIAYGSGEYGSKLNAGYSRDPQSPAYLSPDMQAIRDPGNPEHLQVQFEANPKAKVIIVHGLDDASCPAVHKIAIFRNMVAAGFRPDTHFLTQRDVDGTVFTTTAHPVGNRQKVTEKVADEYLLESGRLALQVPGPDDFERGEEVVFPSAKGRFVVSFRGAPELRFEQRAP
jgi:hypothetical protein